MTLLRQLIEIGVPMAIRISYDKGSPASRKLVPILVTKRDCFYRLNGKIVPKSLVTLAVREGIARM